MKAILVIDLEDNVNLDEAKIVYVIQDKYGTPIKAEVDGCPLKLMPTKCEFISTRNNDYFDVNTVCSNYFRNGWNVCIDEILEDQ